MRKIVFKNGQAPYIDDTNLNKMQDNMEEHYYHIELDKDLEDNSQIELPAYYEVGSNTLEVYFMGTLLRKDEHYIEVGNTGTISNLIQIKDWGDTIDKGLSFDFVIKGTFEEKEG